MNNTKETAAQEYRRECREGRALAVYSNGYFTGVKVCETAEIAAEMAVQKIGPYSTRFEVLRRPVNILKELKASNARRLADKDPSIVYPQALR